MDGETHEATFAGGCFWCLEHAFMNKTGVVSVVSGYTGGHVPDPTYEDVCSGETGHAEAVRITYDPGRVSYRELLDIFWRNIDPTDGGGQFADRGSQYRGAIFYHTGEQKAEAEASRDGLAATGWFTRPIAVTIEPATDFYPAEDYHQQFCLKNPMRYGSYHQGSGRPAQLARIWKDAGK